MYADSFNWMIKAEVACFGCLESAYLLFKRKDNLRFDIELYPNKTCEYIIICFDLKRDDQSTECPRKAEMHIHLKHGILHFGRRKTAVAMNLAAGRSIRIARTEESKDYFVCFYSIFN